MNPAERGVAFSCQGDSLVGVLSLPNDDTAHVGVVIAVGGPQYRAGSHRQFVLLARRLARAGYPVLRFDSRGMGDSSGDFPGFEQLAPDLAAAAAALRAAAPAVRRVVLWGLCDAASAAMMNAAAMAEVAGLVLLNPWVRHADTHARTEVKQYYGQRVFDPAFWRKLLAGRVNVLASAREVIAKVWRMWRASARPAAVAPGDYRERMVQGALAFAGPQLYILSGRDHVCAEFVDYSAAHPQLGQLWSRPGVQRLEMPAADHTFSSQVLRSAVEDATLAWLQQLAGKDRP